MISAVPERGHAGVFAPPANAKRRKSTAPTSSKFKGVSFHRAKQRWRASISLGRVWRHLGYFAVEADAALAYDAAARSLFAAIAMTNERMGLYGSRVVQA